MAEKFATPVASAWDARVLMMSGIALPIGAYFALWLLPVRQNPFGALIAAALFVPTLLFAAGSFVTALNVLGGIYRLSRLAMICFALDMALLPMVVSTTLVSPPAVGGLGAYLLARRFGLSQATMVGAQWAAFLLIIVPGCWRLVWPCFARLPQLRGEFQHSTQYRLLLPPVAVVLLISGFPILAIAVGAPAADLGVVLALWLGAAVIYKYLWFPALRSLP